MLYRVDLPEEVAIVCVGQTCALRRGLTELEERRVLLLALYREHFGEDPVIVSVSEMSEWGRRVTEQLAS